MAFLDELLSIPGASGWLGQFFPTSTGPQSDLLGSINTGGYTNAAAPVSFNDRFPNLPPAGPMPLAPPMTIGQLPQGGQGIPQTAIPQLSKPDEATIPAAATPTASIGQQAIPPYPQGERGGLGDAFRGMMANAQAGPLGLLFGGIAGAAGMGTGDKQTVVARSVYQALAPKIGAQQALAAAQLAAFDPKFAAEVVPNALGIYGPPRTMEEYLARTASENKGSSGIQDVLKLQADYLKNKASAEAQGKDQGAKAAELPSALASADRTLQFIDQLQNHPGKQYAIGKLGWVPSIPGTPQADFIALNDQLKAQGLVNVVQSLRGSGMRITQGEIMEGQKAFARLSRAQTPDAYDSGLKEVKAWVSGLRERAGITAGVGPTPPPSAGSAAPSFTQDQLLAEARRRKLIQ